MAVNVPMTDGPDGLYPEAFPKETFYLVLDHITLSFEHNGFDVSDLKGRLFMTNMRMVFRVEERDIAKACCENLEMPFRGFWNEKLHQPLFGSNNLTGSLNYYGNQPFKGELTVKLTFNEGGVGTFLEVFNKSLKAARIQLKREHVYGNNSNDATSNAVAIEIGDQPNNDANNNNDGSTKRSGISRMFPSYGTMNE